MKTFYDYWKEQREIKHIVTDIVIVSAGGPNFSDCRFFLSQENGEMDNVYWIVATRDGVEIARWNTAHVTEIVWKEDSK